MYLVISHFNRNIYIYIWLKKLNETMKKLNETMKKLNETMKKLHETMMPLSENIKTKKLSINMIQI